MNSKVPRIADLHDGETLFAVSNVEVVPHKPYRSAFQALRELTAVDSLGGDSSVPGPAVGSLATMENRHIESLRTFEVLFGRDSLITAGFLLELRPLIAEQTLLALASVQGMDWDRLREEEPGRIPHEVRDPRDPIAIRITESSGWHWPYFGSVDATPLFILLAVRVMRRRPGFMATEVRHRDGGIRPFREHFSLAAWWVYRRLEDEASGLLVSQPAFSGAIQNQFWKDSWDSYSRADGTVAVPPIASIEAQGLAYEACRDLSGLPAELIPGLVPAELAEMARRVKISVIDRFWIADPSGDSSGYFALGLDLSQNEIVPLRVRASNMGHLLWTGILDGQNLAEFRDGIIGALFTRELLCGGGIRTLASTEARYRPGAYHNGTTWPWDSMVIALGLARNGFRALARELVYRILRVCTSAGCFPEFARGDSTLEAIRFNGRTVDVIDPSGRTNRIEQPPQQIQAWTVAAVLAGKSAFGWQFSSRRSVPAPPAPGVTRFETRILETVIEEGY